MIIAEVSLGKGQRFCYKQKLPIDATEAMSLTTKVLSTAIVFLSVPDENSVK